MALYSSSFSIGNKMSGSHGVGYLLQDASVRRCSSGLYSQEAAPAVVEHLVWGDVDAEILRKSEALVIFRDCPQITFVAADSDGEEEECPEANIPDISTVSSESFEHGDFDMNVSKGRRRPKRRLCKGQRLRLAAQIERLKVQINCQPELDINSLRLPPGISGDVALKNKVFQVLRSYQVECLEGNEVHLGDLRLIGNEVSNCVVLG